MSNQKSSIAILYSQIQWRVNSVSPLYNLQYTPIKLKQYASIIKQEIVSVVNANNAVINVTIKAEGEMRLSITDPVPLIIIVTLTDKIIYEAVLMSWSVFKEVASSIHLPYLLENGEQRAGNAVKQALSTMFDCNITKYSFTQHNLLLFGFLLMDVLYSEERTRKEGSINLTFTSFTQDEKLDIMFEIEDVYEIWTNCKDQSRSTSEQVFFTYQMLQNQIFSVYQLDITTLNLVAVKLPKAYFKQNGTIKMLGMESVQPVFEILNEITENSITGFWNT